MQLLKEYLLLCFFQNDPADMYPSNSFIWKSVVFYLVSGIIVEANISDIADGTLEVVMRTIVALSLIAMIVFATKRHQFFKQLLTAIFICENFIVTLGIGTEILDALLHKTEFEYIPMYLGGVLVIWYLAIIAYITRRVFDYSPMISFSLAFGYFMLTYGGPFLFMEVI